MLIITLVAQQRELLLRGKNNINVSEKVHKKIYIF